MIDILKFSTGDYGLGDEVVEVGLGFTSPSIISILKSLQPVIWNLLKFQLVNSTHSSPIGSLSWIWY